MLDQERIVIMNMLIVTLVSDKTVDLCSLGR